MLQNVMRAAGYVVATRDLLQDDILQRVLGSDLEECSAAIVEGHAYVFI